MDDNTITVTVNHASAKDGEWIVVSLEDWNKIVNLLKSLQAVNVVEVDVPASPDTLPH